MSYSKRAIDEIHILQSRLEDLSNDSSTFSEILKVSEEIDTMLAQ